MEVERIIEWLEFCYQAGYLSDKEIGLDFTEIGRFEFIENLVSMIARHEGLGDTLAEGLLRSEDKFDRGVFTHFDEQYPGIGFAYEMPREYPLSSLLYAMQPRGSVSMIKEISTLTSYWMIHRHLPDKSPMDNDLFRKVAGRFWGNNEAWDLTNYAGKAQAARQIQDRTLANDSLVMCSAAWPLMISHETTDHMGDPALESKLFSAVTGIDTDEAGLHLYGERVFNLQRAILLREGWKPLESDTPEEFNFTHPVEYSNLNSQMIVPGPEDGIQSIKGNVLDRKEYTRMRAKYYQLRGWDMETGLQKTETLERLDMADVAQVLQKENLVR